MRPSKLAAAGRQVRSLLAGGRSARSLSGMLAAGSWIALASAALAGPTTTTTVLGTTTTTVLGTTTTTVLGTTTTTTTAPPTTTTTTTTVPPTTTTTTSTTTTTLAPGDLSGQYAFFDKISNDKDQSFMDVDESSNQICLAGSVRYIDATATLNRSVTFSYDASGPIKKATDKKVSADFTTTQLTLLIQELVPTADGGPITEYNNSISVQCKVKATLKQPGGNQSGEPAQDRVNLLCDLGPSFEAFQNVAELTPALLDNITAAFAKRKTVKADVKKGKLKIKTSGNEVLPSDDANVTVSCTIPAPG